MTNEYASRHTYFRRRRVRPAHGTPAGACPPVHMSGGSPGPCRGRAASRPRRRGRPARVIGYVQVGPVVHADREQRDGRAIAFGRAVRGRRTVTTVAAAAAVGVDAKRIARQHVRQVRGLTGVRAPVTSSHVKVRRDMPQSECTFIAIVKRPREEPFNALRERTAKTAASGTRSEEKKTTKLTTTTTTNTRRGNRTERRWAAATAAMCVGRSRRRCRRRPPPSRGVLTRRRWRRRQHSWSDRARSRKVVPGFFRFVFFFSVLFFYFSDTPTRGTKAHLS